MGNSVFPALGGLQWGVVKSPMFNTRLQQSVGGYETRINFSVDPRWRWTLGYEFLRQNATNAEFQSLANFYLQRRGRYDSFLYSDPTDNAIAAADRLTLGHSLVGDGSTTAFRLLRRLTASGFGQAVYNFNGAPAIYKDNTLQTVTTDYTISASGLVTFVSPPGVGVVVNWYGSYYWRVRFDSNADFSNFASTFWSLGGLSFISVLGS